MKTAKDANSYPLQFGTLVTTAGVLVTTGVQIDADTQKYVRITPTAGDAWVKIESTLPTAGVGAGALIPFGSSLTLVIAKAYYIASTTEINVVPYGYA
jgi:hypothetical protein